MTNWRPESPDMYEDVQTRWQYAHNATNKSPQARLQRLWRSSRDSARTPMQWSEEENAGFTTGTPWFFINDNYKQINVASQEVDPDSLLNFYRKAISLRKSLAVVRRGSYEEYSRMDPNVYIYARVMRGQKLLIVCSFTEKKVKFRVPKGYELEKAQLILHNYPASDRLELRPYEARVYRW